MVKENLLVKSVKFIFRDLILDILYWPVWWYSDGLKKAWQSMKNTISLGNKELGLSIWVKNILKPMFGQYDWQGRIISFFMRLFQIIVRSFLLMFWIVFAFIVFLVWLILPLFLLFQVLYNTGLLGNIYV